MVSVVGTRTINDCWEGREERWIWSGWWEPYGIGWDGIVSVERRDLGAGREEGWMLNVEERKERQGFCKIMVFLSLFFRSLGIA